MGRYLDRDTTVGTGTLVDTLRYFLSVCLPAVRVFILRFTLEQFAAQKIHNTGNQIYKQYVDIPEALFF